MRVTRGLFASLGASGSVTAAGAVALLVLSTVVGVRGWPGVASVRVAPATLVAAQQDSAAPREQRAGRPSTRRVRHLLAATEPPPRRATARRGAPVRATAPATSQPSQATPPQPVAPADASAPSASGAPAAPPSAPVADAVRQTGAAVAPVTDTVTQATETVTDTVDGILKPWPSRHRRPHLRRHGALA